MVRNEALQFDGFVLEIDLRAASQTAHTLPKPAMAVLRLFDGRRSLRQVVEDSDLPVETTLAVVRKLGNMGLLRLGRRGRPGCALPGPEVEQWLGGFVSCSPWLETTDPDPREQQATELEKGGQSQSPPVPLDEIPLLLERSLESILRERLADVPDILDDTDEDHGAELWSREVLGAQETVLRPTF